MVVSLNPFNLSSSYTFFYDYKLPFPSKSQLPFYVPEHIAFGVGGRRQFLEPLFHRTSCHGKVHYKMLAKMTFLLTLFKILWEEGH